MLSGSTSTSPASLRRALLLALVLAIAVTAQAWPREPASAADDRRTIRQVWFSTAAPLRVADQRGLFEDAEIQGPRFTDDADPSSSGAAGRIELFMTSDGTFDESRGDVSLSFSPERFAPGRYLGGLGMTNGILGCGGGEFTIHEIDRDAGSLRLSFTTYCDYQAVHGEVRVDVDVPTADGVVAPGFVRLPDANTESSRTVLLPYVNLGRREAFARSDRAAGPHGEDARGLFIAERCRPRVGRVCWAKFTAAPRESGERRWTVVARWDDGGRLLTPVRQLGLPGHDYGAYRIDSYLGDVYSGISGPEVDATGFVDDRRTFADAAPNLSLTAANGQTRLRVGRYENVERWPFHGQSSGFEAGVYSCGAGYTDDSWFEVSEVAYEPGGTKLLRLAVTFDVRCERDEGRVRGMVGVNASTVLPLPGYLTVPRPRFWPKASPGRSRLDLRISRSVARPGSAVRVYGSLRSEQTGAPIADERVRVRRSRDGKLIRRVVVTTDERGRFSLPQRVRGVTRIEAIFGGTRDWWSDRSPRVRVRAARR